MILPYKDPKKRIAKALEWNKANPEKKKAWKLIKESGCKDMSVGGAKISEKHCNFLVNTGSATSKDLESLGNKIKNKVYKQTGIKLNWEIKRIGSK